MKQLTRYAHPAPLKPQHCPFAPNPVTYGKDNQAPSPTNNSPLLDNSGKKRIQQIVGSFLYYARVVNPTTLMALSADIATQQSAPTKNTKKPVEKFLDYMWTNPNAVIPYRTSDIVLNVRSDASYLSAPCAQSRAGGYFVLGSLPIKGNLIKLNGTIQNHMYNTQTCCRIHRQSQIGCPLSQCTGSQGPPSHSCRTQTPTTTNTDSHQQHYHRRHCQQYHQTPTFLCNGDVILLAF